MLFHIQSLLFFFGSRIEIQQLPFFASACFTFAEIMYLYHVRSDKNTSLFRKHLSATQKQFNIDSIRFPGKCKHFLACFAKNTVVIRHCITVCDLFFYISYCGTSFVSWNFLLNKKVPSALYSADRTFLYGLYTSQEHYSHIILMGIFSTVTPSSVSRSYTDTGSRSLPSQM